MSDQDQTTTDPFAKKAAKKAVRKKVKVVDLINHEIIVLKEDGTDEVGKFDVVKVTSKAIFIKPNIPEMRSVVIDGEHKQVDLNFLKRQPEGAKYLGKPVAAIITAIEIAG